MKAAPQSPAGTVVPAAKDMAQQDLRRHIAKRHSHLGFWSRGEHDAEHNSPTRLIDHEHAKETE